MIKINFPLHSNLRVQSAYLTGMMSNASVLSWDGIHEEATMNNTLKTIHRSGIENIGVMEDESIIRSCKISEGKNCRQEFGNLTERFLLPHGLCKVYVGKPLYNMWFTVQDDEETHEYVLYIADASASNTFTVYYLICLCHNFNFLGYSCG